MESVSSRRGVPESCERGGFSVPRTQHTDAVYIFTLHVSATPIRLQNLLFVKRTNFRQSLLASSVDNLDCNWFTLRRRLYVQGSPCLETWCRLCPFYRRSVRKTGLRSQRCRSRAWRVRARGNDSVSIECISYRQCHAQSYGLNHPIPRVAIAVGALCRPGLEPGHGQDRHKEERCPQPGKRDRREAERSEAFVNTLCNTGPQCVCRRHKAQAASARRRTRKFRTWRRTWDPDCNENGVFAAKTLILRFECRVLRICFGAQKTTAACTA